MHSVRGHHYVGKYIYADIHTEKAVIKYPPTPQHGGPFSWHRTEMFQRVCESVTSKHREKNVYTTTMLKPWTDTTAMLKPEAGKAQKSRVVFSNSHHLRRIQRSSDNFHGTGTLLGP